MKPNIFQRPFKRDCHYLAKLSMYISHDTAIVLDTYPTEMLPYILQKVSSGRFIVALFVIVPNWKLPNVHQLGQMRINNLYLCVII